MTNLKERGWVKCCGSGTWVGAVTHGPYTWEEITGFVRDGNIGKNELLWSPSRTAWVSADQVPGLFAARREEAPAEESRMAEQASAQAKKAKSPTLKSTLFRGSRKKRTLIAGGTLGGALLGVLLVAFFSIFFQRAAGAGY